MKNFEEEKYFFATWSTPRIKEFLGDYEKIRFQYLIDFLCEKEHIDNPEELTEDQRNKLYTKVRFPMIPENDVNLYLAIKFGGKREGLYPYRHSIVINITKYEYFLNREEALLELFLRRERAMKMSISQYE